MKYLTHDIRCVCAWDKRMEINVFISSASTVCMSVFETKLLISLRRARQATSTMLFLLFLFQVLQVNLHTHLKVSKLNILQYLDTR